MFRRIDHPDKVYWPDGETGAEEMFAGEKHYLGEQAENHYNIARSNFEQARDILVTYGFTDVSDVNRQLRLENGIADYSY